MEAYIRGRGVHHLTHPVLLFIRVPLSFVQYSLLIMSKSQYDALTCLCHVPCGQTLGLLYPGLFSFRDNPVGRDDFQEARHMPT